MRRRITAITTAFAVPLLLCAGFGAAGAKDAAAQAMSKMPHRVVIQVSEDNPALMNIALNNAENLTQLYKERGETIEIELVAYGPGLAMMRSDVSPVKARLTRMQRDMTNVSFSGCGNTLTKQSAQENKPLSLVPEAHLVAAGIVRIVELQELGWAYVRP